MPDPITGEPTPDEVLPPLPGEEGSEARPTEGVTDPPPAAGDTGEKFKFAGREFDDLDAAAKSYKEMQQRSVRSEEEIAEIKKRLEQAENPLLQKLVDVVTEKEQSDAEAEQQRLREQLLKDMDERGTEGILDTIVRMKDDVTSSLDQRYRAELEARDAKIKELEDGFVDIRDTSSEVYQQNKERIQKLENAGFTREQAIRAVELDPLPDPAMAAPGSMGPSGASPSSGGGAGWSQAELAEFKKMMPNATKEEIDDFMKSGRRTK